MYLTQDFWDVPPDSVASARSEGPRPHAPYDVEADVLEGYDSLDAEDSTARWLARATESASDEDRGRDFVLDDPAEVPADSMSMISDASRRAATFDLTEAEPPSDYEPH